MKPEKRTCGKSYFKDGKCNNCPYKQDCNTYEYNKTYDEWQKYHQEVVNDLVKNITELQQQLNSLEAHYKRIRGKNEQIPKT